MLIEYLVARLGDELSKQRHKDTLGIPEKRRRPRISTVHVPKPTVCTSSAKSWLASQHIQLLSILALVPRRMR